MPIRSNVTVSLLSRGSWDGQKCWEARFYAIAVGMLEGVDLVGEGVELVLV